MNVIGIVTEYNPFHNGHLYHINKIKEKYNDSLIIVVMSSCFTQRGEYSLLDKWTKTKICLENKIDIVIELPYTYSSQSSDTFAKGAIGLLNKMKVDTICFGSESNNLKKLTLLAKTQINNKKFDNLVNKYINEGINYPTSVNKALKDLTKYNINDPNDLLNISYIKEIINIEEKEKKKINIEIIKRTNDFHDLKNKTNIVSASNIRNKILNNKNINKYVPKNTKKYLKNIKLKQYEQNYYNYLKYSIISNINNLNKIHTIDEGIENRIKKYINTSSTLDELINNIKTKRYTYNKIKRMLNHIINNYTKEDNKIYNKLNYIRVLGFNEKGKQYLNKIKKEIKLPLITNYDKDLLKLETKITNIYSLITNNNKLIEEEYKNKPIYKQK